MVINAAEANPRHMSTAHCQREGGKGSVGQTDKQHKQIRILATTAEESAKLLLGNKLKKKGKRGVREGGAETSLAVADSLC